MRVTIFLCFICVLLVSGCKIEKQIVLKDRNASRLYGEVEKLYREDRRRLRSTASPLVLVGNDKSQLKLTFSINVRNFDYKEVSGGNIDVLFKQTGNDTLIVVEGVRKPEARDEDIRKALQHLDKVISLEVPSYTPSPNTPTL
jgi:hypothetical protein